MGISILFSLKPDFRQIPVKIINYNGFELIWLDRMLNWHPGNIFCHGSKPKSLQTHRNLFGNTQNRPPENKTKRFFVENRCFVQNGFLKSRPHMAALADPQSGKCSYIDRLSFILLSKTGLSRPKHTLLPQVVDLNPSLPWKSIFSFGAIWDLFLEGHTRSFLI